MNTMTALWSQKLYDQFKANTAIERSLKIHELRNIAYKLSGWATRQLFDAEPVYLARIVVRTR